MTPASQPLYLKSPPKRGCDRLQRGLHDDIAGARARPEQLQARQTPDPAEGRPSTLIPEGVPHGFHVRLTAYGAELLGRVSSQGRALFSNTLRPSSPASKRQAPPAPAKDTGAGRRPPAASYRVPGRALSISASAFKASRPPICPADAVSHCEAACEADLIVAGFSTPRPSILLGSC